MDAEGHPPTGDPALADLCRSVFDPLPRSDQRGWAQVYVTGLVTAPGRRSMRAIAAQVPGRAVEQSLQQFVNQSPWRWAPVRQVLAQRTEAALAPRAWVVDEVAFAKNGDRSVGVAVQYVAAARRAENCQLGMATWLVAESGAVPVNWRLMLPRAWDTDAARRRGAHLPPGEMHRPGWEHLLCSVDELVESWDLLPRPVVADRRHDRDVEMLVRGLEQRGLTFALRITDRTPVTVSSPRMSAAPAGEVMRSAARELIALPPPRGGSGSPRTASMLAQAPLPAPDADRRTLLPERRRRLVARWPRGRSAPGQLWITNLGAARLVELLDGLDVVRLVEDGTQRLRSGSGLDHFEGRSFRGWHHHVTLASVAHAHQVLRAAATRAA